MTRSRRPSLRLSRHSSNNSTRRASDARPPGQFEEIADKSSGVVDDDDIRLDNPMQSRREIRCLANDAALLRLPLIEACRRLRPLEPTCASTEINSSAVSQPFPTIGKGHPQAAQKPRWTASPSCLTR